MSGHLAALFWCCRKNLGRLGRTHGKIKQLWSDRWNKLDMLDKALESIAMIVHCLTNVLIGISRHVLKPSMVCLNWVIIKDLQCFHLNFQIFSLLHQCFFNQEWSIHGTSTNYQWNNLDSEITTIWPFVNFNVGMEIIIVSSMLYRIWIIVSLMNTTVFWWRYRWFINVFNMFSIGVVCSKMLRNVLSLGLNMPESFLNLFIFIKHQVNTHYFEWSYIDLRSVFS